MVVFEEDSLSANWGLKVEAREGVVLAQSSLLIKFIFLLTFKVTKQNSRKASELIGTKDGRIDRISTKLFHEIMATSP